MMENMWETSMQKLLKMIITTKDTFTPQERGGGKAQDYHGVLLGSIHPFGKKTLDYHGVLPGFGPPGSGPLGSQKAQDYQGLPAGFGPPGGKKAQDYQVGQVLKGRVDYKNYETYYRSARVQV